MTSNGLNLFCLGVLMLFLKAGGLNDLFYACLIGMIAGIIARIIRHCNSRYY